MIADSEQNAAAALLNIRQFLIRKLENGMQHAGFNARKHLK
jgi:hypothetical protein